MNAPTLTLFVMAIFVNSSSLASGSPAAAASQPGTAVLVDNKTSSIAGPGAQPTVSAGNGLGLQISTGMHGSMSFVEGGVVLPRFFGNLTSGLKLIGMSATNWATFNNLTTGETVSVHPMVVGGLLQIGGTSDKFHDFMRVYGGGELLIGYTFTPYDSYFYQRGNLIGDNITFGLFGYFGAEFFSSPHWAFFIDAGGGFKSLKSKEQNNPYAVAAGWLGSGVTLRVGTRWYW